MRPENNGDDDQRADYYPDRVAASVAGLGVAHAVADAGHALGDAVNGAIDGASVDGLPEDVGGEPEQRLDDEGGVNFVDVIFVQQSVVEAAHGFGELFGLAGLTEV